MRRQIQFELFAESGHRFRQSVLAKNRFRQITGQCLNPCKYKDGNDKKGQQTHPNSFNDHCSYRIH